MADKIMNIYYVSSDGSTWAEYTLKKLCARRYGFSCVLVDFSCNVVMETSHSKSASIMRTSSNIGLSDTLHTSKSSSDLDLSGVGNTPSTNTTQATRDFISVIMVTPDALEFGRLSMVKSLTRESCIFVLTGVLLEDFEAMARTQDCDHILTWYVYQLERTEESVRQMVMAVVSVYENLLDTEEREEGDYDHLPPRLPTSNSLIIAVHKDDSLHVVLGRKSDDIRLEVDDVGVIPEVSEHAVYTASRVSEKLSKVKVFQGTQLVGTGDIISRSSLELNSVQTQTCSEDKAIHTYGENKSIQTDTNYWEGKSSEVQTDAILLNGMTNVDIAYGLHASGGCNLNSIANETQTKPTHIKKLHTTEQKDNIQLRLECSKQSLALDAAVQTVNEHEDNESYATEDDTVFNGEMERKMCCECSVQTEILLANTQDETTQTERAVSRNYSTFASTVTEDQTCKHDTVAMPEGPYVNVYYQKADQPDADAETSNCDHITPTATSMEPIKPDDTIKTNQNNESHDQKTLPEVDALNQDPNSKPDKMKEHIAESVTASYENEDEESNHIKSKASSNLDQIHCLLRDLFDPVLMLCRCLKVEHSTDALDVKLASLVENTIPFRNIPTFSLDCFEEDILATETNCPSLLHFGAKFNLAKLCKAFLSNPVMIQTYSVPDSDGQLPHDIARKNGHMQLAEMLETASAEVSGTHRHDSGVGSESSIYIQHDPARPDSQEQGPYVDMNQGRPQLAAPPTSQVEEIYMEMEEKGDGLTYDYVTFDPKFQPARSSPKSNRQEGQGQRCKKIIQKYFMRSKSEPHQISTTDSKADKAMRKAYLKTHGSRKSSSAGFRIKPLNNSSTDEAAEVEMRTKKQSRPKLNDLVKKAKRRQSARLKLAIEDKELATPILPELPPRTGRKPLTSSTMGKIQTKPHTSV